MADLNKLDIIKKIFIELLDPKDLTDMSLKDCKKCFIVDYILDLTTYDDDASVWMYDYCLPVLKELANRGISSKQQYFKFDWDVSDANYTKYLLICNLLIRNTNEYIEWGTSIRTAWWNFPKIYIDYIKETDPEIYNQYNGELTIDAKLMLQILDWVESDS